jgi:hypothetical protein
VQPFSIQCTTCRRSLRVVNPEAVGQIVSCPKCGSMVMVHAPAGWDLQAATESSSSGSNGSVAASGSAVTPPRATWSNPPTTPAKPDPANSPVNHLEASSAAALAMLAQPRQPAKPAPVEKTPIAKAAPTPEKKSPWKDAPSAAAAETASTSKNESLKAASTNASAPAKPTAAVTAPSETVAATASPPAAKDAWPKWFVPAVAGTLLASVMIFAVRAVLHWSNSKPTTDVATNLHEPSGALFVDKSTAETPSAEPTKTESPADNELVGKPATVAQPEPQVQREPTVAQYAPIADQTASSNPITALIPPPVAVPNEKTPPLNPAPAIDLSAVAKTPEKSETPPVDAPAANLRTLQRVQPRTVNVNARLSDSVPGFESRNLPLVDLLALVSRLSTIPITIDADALAALGQSPSVPVPVHLEKTNVGDLLDAALEPLRLSYQVRDGQLIVGYPLAEKLRQVKYAVPDLVGDDAQALQQLASVVQRMVAPASWQSVGGQGTINTKNGALVVEQSEPAHGEILSFCEKLRIARGLPQKSHFDPARFVLTTHSDRAQAMLQRPITANFYTPAPLATVAKWLGRSTGATILVDHAALARQEMTADSECSVVAVNKPLAGMLDELLQPIDLTWRAIDDRTVVITTSQDASRHMDVEFYPARDLATDAAGHAFIAEVAAKVAPQLWGNSPDQGAMYFDAPGRTLVVRAPQRVQWQVETLLTGRRLQK